MSLYYQSCLRHHGILGQRWGRKNGPPYPLDSSDHSASEKKANWQDSLKKAATTAAKATAKAAIATLVGSALSGTALLAIPLAGTFITEFSKTGVDYVSPYLNTATSRVSNYIGSGKRFIS